MWSNKSICTILFRNHWTIWLIKSLHLWCFCGGSISAFETGNFHIWKVNMSSKMYTQVWWWGVLFAQLQEEMSGSGEQHQWGTKGHTCAALLIFVLLFMQSHAGSAGLRGTADSTPSLEERPNRLCLWLRTGRSWVSQSCYNMFENNFCCHPNDIHLLWWFSTFNCLVISVLGYTNQYEHYFLLPICTPVITKHKNLYMLSFKKKHWL